MLLSCILSGLLLNALAQQTDIQREIWENVASEAKKISAAADDQVMKLFESSITYDWLKTLDDGSNLYLLSPTELHDMFFNELSVAELIHNFGHVNDGTGNCGMDVTIDPDLGPDAPYFYNQWELQALGLIPVDGDNNQFTEHTETSFFHFPPFENVSNPDMATSQDRPMYAALNMYRGSGGNPQCGPIAMVFNRSYIQDQILAAPMDTGAFYGKCGINETYPPTAPQMFDTCNCLNCSSWPPPTDDDDQNNVYNNSRALGIPGYFNHLILPYLYFFNGTIVDSNINDYIYLNLARLIIRLLSRNTYQSKPQVLPSTSIEAPNENQLKKPLKLNFIENTLGYLEFNPILQLNYPEAIGMVVAMFEVLFGTNEGVQLREWCQAQGWVLAWAHNPVDSLWSAGPSADNLPPVPSYSQGIQLANSRILDPQVLQVVPAGANMTADTSFDAAAEYFQQKWLFVNQTTANLHNLSSLPRRLLYDQHWHSLVSGHSISNNTNEDDDDVHNFEKKKTDKEENHINRSDSFKKTDTIDSIGLSYSVLSVEPIFYQACESTSCIAVRTIDGVCVCN